MGDGGAAILETLASKWKAAPVAELNTESVYDFSVLRPIRRASGSTFELEWPGLRLLCARPPQASRDVLLLIGTEPHFRWPTLANALADELQRLGCPEAVQVAVFNGWAAHTRPCPLHVLDASERLASRFGVVARSSGYQGPVGFGSVLDSALAARNIDTATLVGINPFYLGPEPAPQNVIRMITAIDQAVGASTDTSDLAQQRALVDARTLDALARSEEFRMLLLNLERQYDSEQLAAPQSAAAALPEDPRLVRS
jgi:hypothetical protein